MIRPATALIQWLFSTTGSLTNRTARAGLWLAIGDGLGRVAGIVKLVILARLLSPADFGVVALALVVTTWIYYFTEFGFSAALIHQRDDIRPYLDTAWTAQVVRSLVLAAVIATTAPLAAWVFSEPAIVAILRVMAIETIVHGLKNPAVIYFRKDLDTRREVVWRTGGVLAGLLVGIPAAFMFRNAWALVASLMAAAVVGTVTSYWVQPYRPSLRIDWPKLWELARFGRWIFWFRVVSFFTGHLDGVVIGKIVGTTGLGFYQMAHQFTVAPVTTIGAHLHGVMFPAFAKIDGPHRRRALLRALGIVVSLVLPIGLFFTVFGGFIVATVLGPKWQGIEPLVAVLAWAGVMRAIMTVISAFMLAAGHPQLNFHSSLPKLAVLAIALYPATVAYGPLGACVVVAAGTLAGFVYQVILLLRVATFSTKEVGEALRGGLLASLPYGVSWLLLITVSPPVPLLATIATVSCVVIVVGLVHGSLVGRPRVTSA